MIALVVAGLLAQDSGTRWERPLYALCPPAPPSVQLDGGYRLLTPERVARLDCLMVTADERALQLEQAPPPLSATSLLFAGLALGLGLFLGGYSVWWLRDLLGR